MEEIASPLPYMYGSPEYLQVWMRHLPEHSVACQDALLPTRVCIRHSTSDTLSQRVDARERGANMRTWHNIRSPAGSALLGAAWHTTRRLWY